MNSFLLEDSWKYSFIPYDKYQRERTDNLQPRYWAGSSEYLGSNASGTKIAMINWM